MPRVGLRWALLALWWAVVSASSIDAPERGDVYSLHHEDDDRRRATETGASTPPQCTPKLLLPTRSLAVLQDSLVDLRGVRVTRGDSDEDAVTWGSVTAIYAEAVVSLTIRAERGRLALAPGFEDLLPGDWYDGSSTDLHLEGLRGTVNSVLFGLRYLSPQDAGTQEDTIEFSVLTIDHGGGEDVELCGGVATSASSFIAVRVRERPYEPRLLLNKREIGVGNVLTATEGGDVVSLENATIDAGQRRSTLMRVELFAGLGAIRHLSQSTGDSNPSSAQGAPQSSLRFIGTADEVNAKLGQCVYVPPVQRSDEWDRVVFIVQYNARPGGSGAFKWNDETSAVLPVRISAVVRPPTVYWADSGLKQASQVLVTSSLHLPSPLPELTIYHDEEEDKGAVATTSFQLIVRAEHGSFVWNDGSAVGDDRQALELSGSTAELVEKYRRIRYRAPSMRFLLFSLPAFSSRVDRVAVSLVDPTERYQTSLNETVQLDIEKESGWWSTMGAPVRRSLILKEDENTSVVELLNQETIRLADGNLSLSVSARHGRIWQTDEENEAGAVVIEAANARNLITQSSRAWYAPPADFHGYDELSVELGALKSTVAVRVLPVNDAPVIEFLMDQSSVGWFSDPIMILPSIRLDDADPNDLLTVQVQAVNASLGVGDLNHPMFDGISATEGNATVVELAASVARLKSLFASRFIEVAPHTCGHASGLLCAGVVKTCISDGVAANVCVEISFPRQPQYYTIHRGDAQQEVKITAGESVALADLFNATQRAASGVELTLVLTLSTGFLHYKTSPCADWYEPTSQTPTTGDDRGRSTAATYFVTAPDLECLGSALASTTFRTSKSKSGSATIGLELLANSTRPMLNKEIGIFIAPFVEPDRRINVTRVAADSPIQARAGDQLELAAFFTLPFGTAPGEQDNAGVLVDLMVSCTACTWSYDYFVPRVSYEFAELPSSNLTLTGPPAAIAAALKSLKFVVNPVPNPRSGVKSVAVAAREHSPTPDTFEPVSVSFFVEESPLRWSVLQDSIVIRTKAQQKLSDSIQIVGKASNSTLPLRLWIKCIEGGAVLTLNSDTQTRALCGPNEDPVQVTTSRGQINRVLASIVVENHPGREYDSAAIEFAVSEKMQTGEDYVTTTMNVRWTGPRPPSLRLDRDESFIVRANATDPVPLGDVLVADSGAQSAWHSRILTVRASVAHGTLSVPERVCCVEIRTLSAGSELVISGEAPALTAALASTLYIGDAGFTGEDLLTASVALYGEPRLGDAPVTRVRIVVDRRGTGRALASDQLRAMAFDEGADEWGDDVEPAEFTTTDAYLVSTFYSEPEEAEDEFDVEEPDGNDLEPSAELASQVPAVWPLLHIEGTLEDPLSTSSWEAPTIQVDIDVPTVITGVWFVTFEALPAAFAPPNDVVLEVAADHGAIFLDEVFELEAASLPPIDVRLSKRAIVAAGTLDSVNRTLHHLSYQCGYNCPLLDAITLTVRHYIERFEHRHQRKIWVELREPPPVPKVVLDQNVVHMSAEDTAFQFAQISLSGTPSQEASLPRSPEVTREWTPEADPAWLSPGMPAAKMYTLDVTVSTGAVFCTFEIAQCRGESRPQSSAQSLVGSFAALSMALRTLAYQPPVNWNSEQHLGTHVVEWTFCVSDGARINETYADLVVKPRLDPPVINLASVLEDEWQFTIDHLSRRRLQCLQITISEDEAFQFDGLSVRATDMIAQDDLALFNVAISVLKGTLSIGSAARCVSRYTGSDRSSVFAFTASLACVNHVLEALTYTSDPHFSGADALELHVETASTSEKESSDAVTIPLTVVEVNDAPYIATTSREFYSCDEDVACVITDLKLVDPDSTGSGDRLKVTIAVARGSVALLYDTDVSVSAQVFESEGMVLTVEGTLAHLNRALSAVVFTSAKDWNNLEASNENDFDSRDYSDTISITATDFADFNASTTSVFRVFVSPTADPVLIHPPANLLVSAVDGEDGVQAIRGDEDSELSIRGLAFSSVDETSRSSLFVRLSVTHGRLLLPVTDGVSIYGSQGVDIAERELSLRGTFANVNHSVVFVRYLPDANYAGNDAFEVEVHAVDEYTGEVTPTAAISVSIILEPVNDAPSWDVLTPSVPAQLDEPTLISGVSLHDVDVETADCSAVSCAMDVTIEASHGFVTLPRLSQPALFSTTTDVAADGSPLKRSSFLVISGTPSELNAALSEIVFELDQSEYYRADIPSRSHVAVSLRADDRGNFGKGGPQTSATTVYVRPIEWTAHGLLLVVPHTVLSLDEDRKYTFDGAVRVHDPDAARSHRAVLEVDVRCGHGNFIFRSATRGVQVLSNEHHHVVVRGFLLSLNEALNGSLYVPDRDWFGSDEVFVSVRDAAPNAGRNTEAKMFVFVAPVCDPPSWSIRWAGRDQLEAVEDEFLAVNVVSLVTPDVNTGDERSVRVVLSAGNGGLMLAATDGLLVTDREYYTASMSSTAADRLRSTAAATDGSLRDSRLFFSRFQITGSVGDINRALAGLVYKPHRDYNSGNRTSWEEIGLTAWADCDGQLSMGDGGNITLPVAVRAARDPVVLLSQSFQWVEQKLSPEQLLSTLSDAVVTEAFEDTARPLEQLKLVDVDDPEESGLRRFQVTISCWHCVVARPLLAYTVQDKVSELVYLTPPKVLMDGGTNSWSPQLVAVGSVKSLNEDLLSSLSFQSSPNFSGIAIVMVRVDDLSAPAPVGSRSSVTYALSVRVLELEDDAPEIYLPDIPVLQVDENSSVLLRGVQEPASQADDETRGLQQTSLVRVCPGCPDSNSRQQPIQTFTRSGATRISYLTHFGSGSLLFSAHHSTLGVELWKSDGTEAGTALLKDILPGSGSSSPSYLTRFSVDGRVYFSASGPDLSWMLDSDRHDDCQGFYQSRSYPEAFYAVAQLNVWDPDETYDCPLGFHWMSTAEARAIFIGKEMLGAGSEPLAYFDQCGWRGYEWGGNERILFRLSDSKTTGAYKHVGYRDSYHVETSFQTDKFAGVMCVRDAPDQQPPWGSYLWSTDGTAKGTRRVVQLASGEKGAMPSHITEHGGRLFFQASTQGYGAELWSTDGTRAGTEQVADIEPGIRGSSPRNMVSFTDRILFSAHTERVGRELWYSDGMSTTDYKRHDHSHVSTGLVLDICQGPDSSDPAYLVALSTLSGSSVVVFQADDCIHGPELWITDGSRQGTTMLADIRIGSTGSDPRYLTAYANRVYFQANDGVHGAEVWVTDGTAAGTVLLLDLVPGASGSGARYFSVIDFDSRLLFAARADRSGREEFWLSDGTAAGTTWLFPGSEEVSTLDTAVMDRAVGPALVSSASGAFFYLGVGGGKRTSDSNDTESSESHLFRSMLLKETPPLGVKRYSLTVECAKGWLSLGRSCDGVDFKSACSADARAQSIEMEGSISSLNCAVQEVTFNSLPERVGRDEIIVTLKDRSAAGSGLSTTKRLPVQIVAINDPPAITMSGRYFAPLDGWAPLVGIDVSDPDAGDGLLYLRLAVHYGQLRVFGSELALRDVHRLDPMSAGLLTHEALVDSTSGGSRVLEFAVSTTQTKPLLGSLEYLCSSEASNCRDGTRDYLAVDVSDNGFSGEGGPQVVSSSAVILVQSAIA